MLCLNIHAIQILLMFFYAHVFLMHLEARRGHRIPWNWSYEPPHGFWNPNLGPLKDYQLFLTSEPPKAQGGIYGEEKPQ